jgi:FkbM family methyltransferase
MLKNRFRIAFISGILRSCYDFHGDNIDFSTARISKLRAAELKVANSLLAILKRLGFIRVPASLDRACDRLKYVLEHLDDFERVYDMLNDEYSKNMFIDLIKFRVLGSRSVKLPTNNERYWELHDFVDQRYRSGRESVTTHGNWEWELFRFKLEGKTGPLDLYTHRASILDTFLLRQLVYEREGTRVGAEPGDFVIDGGGCWGHTSLFLADQVGLNGKVFSFEFVPENLEIFRKNLSLNPVLAERISLVCEALWDRSGDVINYVEYGPGSSLTKAQDPDWTGKKLLAHPVRTRSIDEFVKSASIRKIDFIKLDVEGSELQALRGAAETIRTFKPRLAVSAYHKEEDLLSIPSYLNSLGAGYKIFLDHFSISSEETMVFASPH